LQSSLGRAYLDLWGSAVKRLSGEETAPVVAPDPKDRRFADPEWSSNQFFDFIKQAYLLATQWAQSLVDDAKDGRITILHLSDKTCKWPIGDPTHEDFCFCGHGPREGSPYCEYHARIAYQPPQARMRRAG